MNQEVAKEIVSQLYEYTNADFSQDTVKFKFCRDVQRVLHELRQEGIYITQNALQHGHTSAMFVGVTFEGGVDAPTYCFQRIVKN